MSTTAEKYEVDVVKDPAPVDMSTPQGVLFKKLSVILPVAATTGIVCGNRSWDLEPLFAPELAFTVIMGIISFMYIVAFWLPAEALHIFFTVKFEVSKAIPDNKVWGFFALASINWLATTSLLFLLCTVSNPCPTRLLELSIFCFLYNIRGHLVMVCNFGCPGGAVTVKDAAGDIIPIWTACIICIWQYFQIPHAQ